MSLPPSLRRSVLLLSATATLAYLGCAADEPKEAGERVADTHESFDAWKASLPRDPNDGAYIVEGDLGVRGEATLQRWYAEHGQPGALIVNTRDDDSDDRWSDARKMDLTYCVSPRFGERREEVTAAVASAASGWMRAAAVRFIHSEGDEDGACDEGRAPVVFTVTPVRHWTSYNARSFLPSMVEAGPHAVLINLDNIDLAAPKTLTGVLLHELGHVLGFRHEHARPESNGVCTENSSFRPLTPYDPVSVMHYPAASPCKGAQEGDYALSPLDVTGARTLYGAPE